MPLPRPGQKERRSFKVSAPFPKKPVRPLHEYQSDFQQETDFLSEICRSDRAASHP